MVIRYPLRLYCDMPVQALADLASIGSFRVCREGNIAVIYRSTIARLCAARFCIYTDATMFLPFFPHVGLFFYAAITRCHAFSTFKVAGSRVAGRYKIAVHLSTVAR